MLGGFTGYLDPTAPFRGVWAPYPASLPRADVFLGDQTARLELMVSAPAVARLAKTNTRAAALLRSLAPQAAGGYGGYIDLIITDINIAHQERTDPHEAHGDAHAVYAMGAALSQLSMSGAVLHTQQDNWFDQLAWLWQDVARAWRLAARGSALILRQGTLVAHLAPMSLQLSRSSSMQMAANFSMASHVLHIEHMQDPNAAQVPTRYDVARAGSTTVGPAVAPVVEEYNDGVGGPAGWASNTSDGRLASAAPSGPGSVKGIARSTGAVLPIPPEAV